MPSVRPASEREPDADGHLDRLAVQKPSEPGSFGTPGTHRVGCAPNDVEHPQRLGLREKRA
jgi:hypothetical protein